MNLTQLKAEAEKAKTSDIELGFWREDISPDDVLRLVKIAEEAQGVVFAASQANLYDLRQALKGVED